MSQVSVNKLMVIMKAVRERLNELKGIRNGSTVRERWFNRETGAEQKVSEPQYDVKMVDRKVSELERFLLMADSEIKTSNAITKVDVDFDVDKLLEPLQ